MTKINLPSKAQALVININNLNNVNVDFFAKIDLSKTDRYVCLYYNGAVKAFAMAIKTELSKKEIVEELKNDLEFQIKVLQQL